MSQVEFYAGFTAATGVELWSTDGTAGGTTLIKDIRPGAATSNPNAITPLAAGGAVFFASDGPSAGLQLFVTDGTAGGTVELEGVFVPVQRPRSGLSEQVSSSLADPTPFGSGALFAGDTSQGAVQLWFTDGTYAGTRAVQSFGPSGAVTLGGITTLSSGRAVFEVGAGASQPGLWGTDGTTAGTIFLSSQVPTTIKAIGDGLALTVLQTGYVLLGNGTATLGVTDGTQAGTRTLSPTAFVSITGTTPIGGGRAVFAGGEGSGINLWVSDGTDAGTKRLVQSAAGSSFNPAGFTPLGNGETVFSASNGTAQTAVWVTDGTTAGTMMLVDTMPGQQGYSINTLTAFGTHQALFAVQNGSTGTATVWSTDGTVSGTVALLSIPSSASSGINAIPLGGFAALPNGRAVFDVLTGSGEQVYVTDGTLAGTSVIATIQARTNISPASFTVLPDGKATFVVTNPDGSASFYATNGTAAGTIRISGTIPQGPVAIATAAAPHAGLAQAATDPLFDTGYYLAHNPDVTASSINPYQHYLALGGTEGRNPDAFFDSSYYLAQNPDVAASGMNPLQHFEQYGWKEGRDPSLVFSDSKYLAANPDVAAANIDPLQHFLQYGQSEGRMSFLSGPTGSGDLLVDPAYYDTQLGATLIPYGGNLQQAASSYDQVGWHRGLNPDALFNTNYYLAANPDVAASGIDPLTHFEQYGWKEGRNPSADFSTSKYLAANSDIAQAGIDPLVHYVSNGQYEGRAIYPA